MGDRTLLIFTFFMSLVFAALVPHPPVLIPTIGKEQLIILEETRKAYEHLEEDIYTTKPQLIIIISPHGSVFTDAFSVNGHVDFVSKFEQFGDFSTKKRWQGCPEIAARIGNEAKIRDIPVQILSQGEVDHGASVPLFYLTHHLPEVKVLPVGFCNLSTDRHLVFGELLKDVILHDTLRIAVIASGDLSHCLTVKAPVPYHPDGEVFDRTIRELLTLHNTTGITAMDQTLVDHAAPCGYRSLVILLGILKNMKVSFKQYAYEAPFGIGYLTGNFVL